MRDKISTLTALILVVFFCFFMCGCVTDSSKSIKNTHTDFVTLENAVNTGLTNNSTYKTMRKTLIQSNTEYFKTVSKLKSKLKKIKVQDTAVAQNALHMTISLLNNLLKTKGEEYTFNRMKALFVEDIVQTFHQIQLYRSVTQCYLAEKCNYTGQVESEQSNNKTLSSKALLAYSNKIETAKTKLKETNEILKVTKQKLVKLMGYNKSLSYSDIQPAPIELSMKKFEHLQNKDYFINLSEKFNNNIKLKKEFLKVLEYYPSSPGPNSFFAQGLIKNNINNNNQNNSSFIITRYNNLVNSISIANKMAAEKKVLLSKRDHIMKEYNDGKKASLTELNKAQLALVICELDCVDVSIVVHKNESILNFISENVKYSSIK